MRRTLVLALVLGGVVLGALAWLGTTAGGAHALLALAARHVDLRYAAVGGSLVRGLEIRDLELRTPAAELTLAAATVRWRPRALLAGTLALPRVALAHGALVLVEADSGAASGPPRIPLAIAIDALEIRELTVEYADQRRKIDAFTAQLRAAGTDYALREFRLVVDGQRAEGHALLSDGATAVDLAVAYHAEIARDGTALPVAATLKARGPLRHTRVELAVSAPFTAAIDGIVDVAAPVPELDLRGSADPMPWLVATGLTLGVATVEFRAAGSLDALVLSAATTVTPPDGAPFAVALDLSRLPDRARAAPRANLHWRVTPAAPLLGIASFEGGGEIAWRAGRIGIEQRLTAPAPLAVHAEIASAEPRQLTLHADWQDLALELATGVLRAPRGRLSVEGVLPKLALELEARFADERIGPIELHATGALDADRFELATLDAKLLRGALAAHGALTTLAPPRGEFEVALRGLDLAALRRDLETQLAANLSLALEEHTVRVDLKQADGRWRDRPLAARGRVAFDTQTRVLSADGLRLAIGDNRLEVDGTVDAELSLDLSLDAPALAEIDRSLAGAVHGSGRLRGTSAQPTLTAELTARALAAGALRVASARLTAALAPTADATLRVAADGVRIGSAPLGPLRLDAQGTLATHTLELTAGDGPRRFALRAAGRYDAGRSTGTLRALTAAWPNLGAWRLREEAHWGFANDRLDLTSLCLEQERSRVCVEAHELRRDGGRAHASLRAFPLASAAAWLPPSLAIEGTLNGEFDATHAEDRWQLRSRVDGERVALVVPYAEEQRARVTFAPLALTMAPTTAGQRFELSARSAELGELTASATVRESAAGATIDSRLRLQEFDLAGLAGLAPALFGSTGHLELTAELDGPLRAPALRARARLVDGRLRLEPLGIELDAARFDATTRGSERIDLSLDLGQREQRLALRGHVDRAPGWPYALHVASARFTALRRAELDADIAPSLDVDGTLADVRVHGTLGVPLLRVRLQSLGGDAVAVSADEVLLDETGAVVADSREDSSALGYYRDRVTGELRIELGDEASVSGLGLDARLAGALVFTKEAHSLGFADGRITLKDGRYVAYRQRLELKKGELSFAGSLLNPRLDVLALRPNLPVTAGVAIGGTAQAPLVRLYSSPALADLETLSYVITGEPLSATNKSAAGLLSKAALGLGLEQATGLTHQLRDWFALDELGVNGGETVTDTSFVAGKQLTPRIRVRSEFNPFDRLWAVFLRYRLARHWSVEGESGARQGADLLYSIERDELF